MANVKDFFDLDKGFTKHLLEVLVQRGLDYRCDPYYVDEWKENPFDIIARDDWLWGEYVQLHPGQLTLTSYFRSLAICQFYIMRNMNGPEGDGAMQMLRKHWYAWGKSGLQNAARRLGVGLMPNGEPDSEKLYDLMSRTFGDWNKDGLLEYRQIWILDNTTKMILFDRPLPSPFDGIVICCEKDAAFNGVALSAKAMGACAVYSGGGKSSRAGIEKMYYSRLKKIVDAGSNIYVLVISDWDTDGEAVIAPTFVEQLKTYIPEWQLQWVRVGITPEQITRLGYEWDNKWYDLKWDVNGMLNYYQWSGEKAVVAYSCQGCHSRVVEVGTRCPYCGHDQVPPVDGNGNGHSKDEKDAMKEEYRSFFGRYTPHGFELDALTRVEYCDLLVEGLSQLVYIDDICQALSELANPSESTVAYDIRRKLLNENTDYNEIEKHLGKLQRWFSNKTQELNEVRWQIERDAEELAGELVRKHIEDSEIFENDDECWSDGLAQHMRDAKFNEGRCNWCGNTTNRCYDPERHKVYWTKDADETEFLDGVTYYQPFSEDKRNEKLAEIVLEEEEEAIEEFAQKEYEYEEVDLGQDDDDSES